jgi:hypothetical protein
VSATAVLPVVMLVTLAVTVETTWVPVLPAASLAFA